MQRVIFKSGLDLNSRKTARKYYRWTVEAEGKSGQQKEAIKEAPGGPMQSSFDVFSLLLHFNFGL